MVCCLDRHGSVEHHDPEHDVRWTPHHRRNGEGALGRAEWTKASSSLEHGVLFGEPVVTVTTPSSHSLELRTVPINKYLEKM